MKKAVVFDLDGTLTNTLASIKKSADLAVGKFGFGPFSEDQYRYFVGEGAAVLIERCLEAVHNQRGLQKGWVRGGVQGRNGV